MIGRTVLWKVAVFALITVLGVCYTAVRYLGIGSALFTPTYDVAVDFADSGGIFTGAEVTYRGVSVGRVGEIELREGGIRVTLNLQTEDEIPARLRAVVANGSAVGEQYIDLQPVTAQGPFLEDGSVIPQADTALPVSVTALLTELDDLVTSVPRDDLQTVVAEAGAAFADRGSDLQRLLDSSSLLVAEAQAALPATTRLLIDAETVLETQRAEGTSIVEFSRNLALLSETLKDSDGDLTTVLRDGVPAATELGGLVDDISPALTRLLDDLVGVTEVLDQRSNNIRQLFIYYPYLVSASLFAFPGDNTARFGVPLNQAGAPACREGYMPVSEWQDPNNTTLRPFPYDSFCQAPEDSDVAVRGARNAPENGAAK